MNCPKCNHADYSLAAPCPACDYAGDPGLLERLSNLSFLLAEVERWVRLASEVRANIRGAYEPKRREVEVALGLRAPPLDSEAAHAARIELVHLSVSVTALREWVQHGWVEPEASQRLEAQATSRMKAINDRLLDAPAAPLPPEPQLLLLRARHRARWVEELRAAGHWTSETAYHMASRESARQIGEQEIRLGLRKPLDAQAAQAAMSELNQLAALVGALPSWTREGWLTAEVQRELEAGARSRMMVLRVRLVGAPRVKSPPVEMNRLVCAQFLAKQIDDLHAEGRLASEAAYQASSAELAAEIEALEAALEQRPEAMPAPVAKPKREPLTWNRIWETLLSERTLHAILFLGAGLLFAAAVSLIIWKWEAFPPLLQVFFLALFTSIFYALGWYVRTRMKLRQSGIALSAVASLLVPLDFYAFYLSGGFPADSWPQVWLLTSAVCLIAYSLAAYWVGAEFFGYLVALATGSLVASGMRVLGLDINLWQAGLAGLALLMALLGEWLHRREIRWRVLARPLWRVSLVGMTTIMVLGFGWALTGRVDNDLFHIALALDWWLGGLLFILAAPRYRIELFGLAAAVVFPIAVWLTQSIIFDLWQVAPAWHALGWSLLAPIYLFVARPRTRQGEQRESLYGRVMIGVGIALCCLSGGWAVRDSAVVSVVHPILAATAALSVSLWRRPWLALLGSLLLLSGTAGWMASLDATLGQLGLAWALLAILHIAVALRLKGLRIRLGDHYDTPVYVAGWAIAALAILPTLVTFDRPNLTYTLGNWIAISAWLALLSHSEEAPGLCALLASRRLRPTLFQWAAALPLPIWIWLAWLGPLAAGPRMVLAYLPAAWALLAMALRLRRVRWEYGRPWATAAHLCNLMAAVTPFVFYDQTSAQAWAGVALLLASGFYFASALLLHHRLWLVPGGIAFPAGLLLLLDWLGWGHGPLGLVLALVVAAYVGGAALLERARINPRSFWMPLYTVAKVVTLAAFVWGLVPLFRSGRSDATLMWTAGGQLVLGISAAGIAWLFDAALFGHIAAWLGVFAGSLVVAAYTDGSGSAAAWVAVMAVLYVIVERLLRQLCLSRQVSLRWRRAARQAWRLFRHPLLVAGWAVSIGAIDLASIHNLVLLEGGRVRETWAVISLLLVTGLYAGSARLFRKSRFVWFSAILITAPWALLTHLGWFVLAPPSVPDYALSYVILALLQLAVGSLLAARLRSRQWSAPCQVIAHVLLPLALLWGIADVGISSITFGLAVVFYLAALWIDRWQKPAPRWRARFLYPAAVLLPVWAVYLLARFAPSAPQTAYGFLLLGFSLPLLLLGRWLSKGEPAYRWPLYLTAYGVAVVGTALVAYDRPAMIAALVFDSALAVISGWTFRQPQWLYATTAALPAAMVLALLERNVPNSRHGWALIALGGLYLLVAWLLRLRPALARYGTPILTAALAIIALGLVPSSQDRMGALVGYGGAVVLYSLAAFWLQRPLLLTVATGLAAVPYWMVVLITGVPRLYHGLVLWPGIAASLGLAHLLDRLGTMGDDPLAAFPWFRPAGWARAVADRLTRWWSLPLYAMTYVGAAASAFLSLPAAGWILTCTLSLAALVYGLATVRFRLRGWLLAAVVVAQLAALSAIHWWGWWDLAVLAFAPVTWATALAGLTIERRLGEGPPIGRGASWRQAWQGWSRPLYVVLLADLLVGQAAILTRTLDGTSALVTLSHALLLAVLATAWLVEVVGAYPALLLGLVALAQHLAWRGADLLGWAMALALLALAYGLVGYLLRFLQTRGVRLPRQARIWDQPLRVSGLVLSGLSLQPAILPGFEIGGLVIRLVFGFPMQQPLDTLAVQTFIGVVAIVGLLYLAAALTHRIRWLGYGAVGVLMAAWFLEWLLVWGLRDVQWYAVPAGIYLFGIGYLECKEGSKSLACWIDRAAMVLLLGSAFWQSIGAGGWPYALLLGVEGLAIGWWGSARRVKRFLYAGVGAVTLAVVGQLVEPLRHVGNLWIVFGVAGALLVALAILIERQLDRVRALSLELRTRLEGWE